MGIKEVVTAFLEWLGKVAPGLIGAFGLGYKVGQDGKQAIKNELAKSKLQEELTKNELQNEKDFEHKSDADVIRAAAKSAGSSSTGTKPDSK